MRRTLNYPTFKFFIEQPFKTFSKKRNRQIVNPPRPVPLKIICHHHSEDIQDKNTGTQSSGQVVVYQSSWLLEAAAAHHDYSVPFLLPLLPAPTAKPVLLIPEPECLLQQLSKQRLRMGEATTIAGPYPLLPPSQHQWCSPFFFHPPILEKSTKSCFPVTSCFCFGRTIQVHFTVAAKHRLKNLQLSVIKMI